LDPGFAVTIATVKLKAKQSSIKKAITFDLTFVTNRKMILRVLTKKGEVSALWLPPQSGYASRKQLSRSRESGGKAHLSRLRLS